MKHRICNTGESPFISLGKSLTAMFTKATIKKFIPPIILEMKNKFNSKGAFLSPQELSVWWNKYKTLQTISPDLVCMMDYFISTSSFLSSSGYWNYLCKLNVELLVNHGIKNFKQTVERMSYWGEASLESVLIKPLLNDPINIQIETKEIFKYYDLCSKAESIQHNLANVVMLNYLVNNGYEKYLFMEDSLFGNPIYIRYKDKRYSFALLNAILEIDVISKNIPIKSQPKFLEIGGGAGRTCLALLNLHPNSKYVIVDIPPALYVSQENISQNFKNKKIFKFKPFSSYAEVKNDLESSDIVFISPEQLSLLPDKSIDIAIAIDCLHEMTYQDVQKYFVEFNRLASYLYFKCQNSQWAKTSQILLTIDTYPIMSHWRKILHDKCYVPNDYFNAVYKM